MKKRIIAIVLAQLSVVLCTHGQEKPKQDQLCRLLYDTYIGRRLKVSHSSVLAATHIVAHRGRNNGFWKVVLADLKKGSDNEPGCVRLLGRMLEIDAQARDAIRGQEKTRRAMAWEPVVALSKDVVRELLERGKKAERHMVDHYTIALVRARVPETADFFRSILKSEKYDKGIQYHAAVGLAQLADPAGYEWLIASCQDPLPTVSNAWPPRVPNYNVSTCCTATLKALSGEGNLKNRNGWKVWWEVVDKKKLVKQYAPLADE